MNTKTKNILAIVLVLGGLYASFICFNEINPWVGILLCVVTLGLGINYVVKQFKNQK